MSRDAGDGRKAEVGETSSPIPVDKDICLRRWVKCKCGDIPFGKNSYPFQISVNHPEAMHVRQPVCNVDQLNSTSVRLL
jgi:hypothetical protein